ncbi:MAG TPA: mechanosensitive ion channel family protein [Vicinamibacterales bacterium]|nr:mechanosensitive ion channel family protein [Vicinamibacterales bacterium]
MNWALTQWPLLDHSIWTAATIAVGFAVGFLINRIVISRLQRLAAQTAGDWDDAVVLELRRRIPFWGVLAGAWVSIGYWAFTDTANAYSRNVISALAVLSVTTALAGIAGRLMSSLGPRLHPEMQVSGLMRNLVRLVIFTIGLLIVLDSFSVQITPVLAALGVGGLAVALALQDPLSNLFAGLFITLAGQVRIGDHIRLEAGPEGTVADFSWHATQLLTPAGNVVIIPNAKITQAVITNFHRPSRESGTSVELTIVPGSDLSTVERIGLEVARSVMAEVPGGVPGAEPGVRFTGFTDLGVRVSVNFRTRAFSDQALVKHELIKRLETALQNAGVTIATASAASPRERSGASGSPRVSA